MLPDFDRPIQIDLTVKSDNSELLKGLDVWLNLGLISETTIKAIAQNYLSCLIPEPKPKTVAQDSILNLQQPVLNPQPKETFIYQSNDREKIAAFESSDREEIEAFIYQNELETIKPDRPNIILQIWRSLKDEFSIRWLLFLGVFLVMVSSGVLAATQWEKFPAAGQYMVLWSYTLVFWGVAFWAAKQDSLQLTTRTLETIALLLIPLNFWAIDSLNLWNNFLGWLVIAIASLSLTAIYLIQNRSKQNLPLLLNFLLLSYLHWGWNYHNLALVAVYIGAIGTTFTVSFLAGDNSSENSSQIKLNRGLIIFSLAVLLVRAIFIFSIPIQQLGLAIGMCGWLLTREKASQKNIEPESIEQSLPKIGTILLFIAWLVSVWQTIPWQATIINVLAIEYCFRQLQQNWLRRDLLAIFVIGFQAYFLSGYLIPQQLRVDAIEAFVSFTNSSAYPIYSLYSLSLFPYLIFCIWMTNWLDRKEKQDLVIFLEWLTLFLGILLTWIGFYNPMARSLNLFLSTATLFYVSIRRIPTRVVLVYLTHILGLSTIASSIDYWFPNLSNQVWASIFVVLMVIELGISTVNKRSKALKIWYESCWYIGLSLAAISYILLLDYVPNFIFTENRTFISGLSWLLTPVTLTIVASRVEEERRINAVWLSSFSAIAVQFLTVWQPLEVRLFGLSVATGLMLVNTRYGKDLKLAAINIGFALSFFVALFWGNISLGNWYLVGAIAIVVLWCFRNYLLQKNGTLANIYSKASDGWGYFICISELSILSFNYIPSSIFYLDNYTWQYTVAPILIGSAILYRSEKERIINLIWLSCLCAIALLFLTLWQPTAIKLLALTIPTGLMLVNSRYSQNISLATLNLGVAVAVVVALLWQDLSLGNWYLVGAIAIAPLWVLGKYLRQKNGTITNIYSKVADGWAYLLSVVALFSLTLNYLPGSIYYLDNYTWQYTVAPILISSAIAYRYWRQPDNKSIFCFAWAIESSVSIGILLAGGSNLELATANIFLAILSLLVTRRLLNLFVMRSLPLIYAFISIAWRWNYFTAYTGWLTLAAAITGILVGSRYMEEGETKNTDTYSYGKTLSYFSVAGITFGCYELVIYQMMQSSGGSIADGITILAMVAAAIALFYRLFVWFWHSRERDSIFELSLQEITIVAHLHWVLASILKIVAGGIAVENDSRLFPLSIAVSLILATYALIQGRNATNKATPVWVYVGIVEIIATTVYARLVIEQLSVIDPWIVIIVCLVSLFIYRMPWQSWGWQPTPWHFTSLVLPATTAIVTADNISYLSLVAVAVFYARIAIVQKNVRWSYLTVGFLDGAIVRFALENNLTNILFYASVIGVSLLYIAQFDRGLIEPENKQSRHYLRVLGIGIICFVALLFHQDRGGILPIIISSIAIFAGLGFQIRAFLFAGTTTFVLTVFYHLIVLSFTYSFLKWIIGLIAGIVLIAIAANFEKRSEQIIYLMRNWFGKLQQWE